MLQADKYYTISHLTRGLMDIYVISVGPKHVNAIELASGEEIPIRLSHVTMYRALDAKPTPICSGQSPLSGSS